MESERRTSDGRHTDIVEEKRHAAARPGRRTDRGAVASIGGAGVFSLLAGAIGAALAVVGLAGVAPTALVELATIAVGAGLLLLGAVIGARTRWLARASESELVEAELGGGAVFFIVGGAAVVALGLLALVGVAPATLIRIAIIAFGGTLILGSTAVWELAALPTGGSTSRSSTGPMVKAAAALAGIAGVGALVLGILSLAGVSPLTLALVALAGLGTALVLVGAAVAAKMAAYTPTGARENERAERVVETTIHVD